MRSAGAACSARCGMAFCACGLMRKPNADAESVAGADDPAVQPMVHISMLQCAESLQQSSRMRSPSICLDVSSSDASVDVIDAVDVSAIPTWPCCMCI